MSSNIILPPHMQHGPENVRIEIGSAQGKVIIAFEQQIDNIVMTPADCADFARKLAQAAYDVGKQTGQIVPKPGEQN